MQLWYNYCYIKTRLIMNINSKILLSDLEIFIKQEQKDDNFNAGMIALYQYIEKYTKEPDFILEEEFKDFALQAFLNNDLTQLGKLTNVIELFTLLYQNVEPLKNWNEGPGSLDYTIFSTFSNVLNGYTLSNFSEDWDNEWFNLFVTFKKNDGQIFKYGFDSYGRFDKENFEEADRAKYHKLRDLLNVERYESLFLYINLSVAFGLIDENKVKEEITNIKNTPTAAKKYN